MPVQIGSKFTGRPQTFIDTTNGAFWEVLPKIEGDAIRIQREFLKPRAPVASVLPTLASRYAKLIRNFAKN